MSSKENIYKSTTTIDTTAVGTSEDNNNAVVDNDNNNNNNDNGDDFEGKLLHLSCLWNNPELLSDLLLGDEIKNINSQDVKGRTALHEAVVADSLECARLLLMNGADPNIRQHSNKDSKFSSKSCLHLATQRGKIEIVRLLLEFNADLFQRDGDGLNAMDLARKANHQEIFDELKAAIEEQESNQYKLLAIAVHKGDNEAIKKHLSEVVDNNNDNETNEESVIRIKSILNYVPNGSNTLLFKACQEGHLEIVEQLIQSGADARLNPSTKYSPLYIAAYHGRFQICRLLLEHFPELSSIYTVEHWLPIHAAVMNNHQDIVQLLLNFNYPYRVMKPFLTESSSSSSATASLTTRTSNSSFDASFNSTNHLRNVSKSMKSLNEDEDNNNCDNQFVYLMPFDINSQDIAGQTILYLATLIGNQSLIDYLLNFRLKAIVYDANDPIINCLFNRSNSNTNDNIDNEIYEDCLSNSSSSSSLDITVISPVDKSNKSSQKVHSLFKFDNNISSSSSSVIIDEDKSMLTKLYNLLNNNDNKPSLSLLSSKQTCCKENSNETSRKETIDSKEIFFINPIKIDVYCNHNMETALHCAVKKRHYSVASMLLEHGADPNNPINGVPPGNTAPIVTRVSHFNHNLFGDNHNQTLSIRESLKELKNISGSKNNNTKEENDDKNLTENLKISNSNYESSMKYNRSTALREAVRNRDKAMFDLLLRFGARDNINDDNVINHQDLDTDSDQQQPCDNRLMSNALSIAFSNLDFHFVSKLLSLKAYPDPEYKVNKKSFDIIGSNCMNALNRFHMHQNLTVSSMFPSNPVMVDWHSLKIFALDEPLNKNLTQWLIDSALVYNLKLKLSHIQDSGAWNTALAAITRIDLSENGLTYVPFTIFTDLPSLKILNLSKNKLQTLPEMKIYSKDRTHDDDSVIKIFRNSTPPISDGVVQSSTPINNNNENITKGSKFLSMMRKSQSVTANLSTGNSSGNISGHKNKFTNNKFNRNNRSNDNECGWNLPCLEEFYLQDNQLECLPSSLFQQPELKILDLSNNKLRTLPPLFWFAPKLNELNLSFNLLCDLPSLTTGLNNNLMQINDLSPSTTSPISIMSKSVSTSSISSNLSIGDLKLLDLESSKMTNHIATNVTNLIPFELNVLKPWSGCVTILEDPFHEQNFHEHDKTAKESIASLQNDEKQRFSTTSSSKDYSGNNLNKSNNQSCSLTQLNLSHNGFDRIPFLLSCLATRLTHLNISYNRLKTIFDPYYILGHFPLSLKHLDLSHNQINEWFIMNPDDSDLDSELSDDFSTETRIHCFHSLFQNHHYRVSTKSPTLQTQSDPLLTKICPFKQHTKLDNLKTLILSNNRLKEIIITREELIEWIDIEFGYQKIQNDPMKNTGFQIFNLSSSFNSEQQLAQKPPLNSSSISAKLFSNFGSQDDIHSNSTIMDDNINLNYKASRYAKLFFPNLSMLDMANNQISRIPKTISYLYQLSVLNLSGNTELVTLPPEMGLLTKLWNLNTRGCDNLEEPLKSMIQNKSYKTSDIISYLNSILENSKPYNRLKLMIVGYQSIGKTSLLEQLRQEGSSRSRNRAQADHWGKRMGSKSMQMKTPRGVTLSTVGVDLCEWTYERRPLKGSSNIRDRSLSRSRFQNVGNPVSRFVENTNNNNVGPITFRTWDFGGQREYYATHQYFLSKRSIYLVVWKITDGEKGVIGMHSWLVNIQSRAPNSPVIIVGTHYDLVKEFYPPFFSSELQNMIQNRYMSDSVDADKRGLPKVVASIEVSTKTRHNIRLLANLIYETALEMRSPGGKERLLEQKVPATYLALEEIVTILAMERKSKSLEPVLHAEQYRQEVTRLMKEKYDLSFRDYSELQQATRFLHDNGVLLHYEDAHLKDLYFLDPQWLCDMLAHVVTIREINPFVKNGIMKTEHLLQLFKNTQNSPVDVQSYLLNLLNKFELAITWDNRTLLIPSLLPTEEQLRAGHSGGDIAIPLKSRLKTRNQSNSFGDLNSQTEFKNELSFQELLSNKILIENQKNNEAISDNSPSNTEKIPKCTVTALARHNQSVHRILILSYVPCGFWSRLIARVLADETVIEIVRSFYSIPSFDHDDPLLVDFFNNVKTYWHCWQTGFALRYLDTFLLRVKEYSLINSNESKIINFSSTLKICSYPYDYNRIRFFLRQQKDWSSTGGTFKSDQSSSIQNKSDWFRVDISSQSSSLIEIYLPNQPFQIETQYWPENADMIQHKYFVEPNMEMLTKLLVIIVEHIDTLLEDWYPSLGTRFIHTSDGKFLITRIVPCTLCMQSFINETIDLDKNCKESKNTKLKSKEILSPDTSEIDSNLVDFYKLEVKKATIQSSDSNNLKVPIDPGSSIQIDQDLKKDSSLMENYHRVNAFMVEECILSVYEDAKIECPNHSRIRIDKVAPDLVFRDLKDSYRIESDQLKFGKLLGRGSFGFVFRAYYKPKFSSTNDVGNLKKDSYNSVSNSTFYVSRNESIKNYEVALKLLQPIKLELCSAGIRKADIEAYTAMKSKWERDPLQYSCKAYCTARTELNILLTLKHSNIASIIGICPKPLALVLTLAPQGSLDVHIKSYRRSGARISATILQKTFLQISKALEYLHQQHIIYRDLKSENVLVWSFPHPCHKNHPHHQYSFNQSNHFNDDVVILKLADYGISRSSLPTGTKGFGGTEGFMAPEIMLFNGEEEYTEKVDCFSFAMFMYELSTLRFPFEGQEFAIRENILDGIRPAISQKDLDQLPESFIDLMCRAWAHEPNERPTMSQIVSIISAPEFCSLRDVATLSDNCALICAIGFQKNDLTDSNSRKRFGLFLSKIGKQIDFLEAEGSKWNPIGYRLACENLNKRTITSVCVVNGNQLWLGDSMACINVYCFNENNSEELFQFICLIQLELENPASLTAIKSICWMEQVNLITLCSNNGEVWLLNFKNLMIKLESMENLNATLSSSFLGMKRIDNNNLPILCVANVSLKSSIDANIETSDHYFDIWCGRTEGKITILTMNASNLNVLKQSNIDHYEDAHFNQFNVPIDERNDVFLLVGYISNQKFICSVLYSGYIIYQWDASKKKIVHKLDCSKLAPCSESLMSISIEDHLKPGNCRISEVAINEDNDELYVGTNFGCIIIAELRSLKPITVFRPYQREVKFIITLNDFKQTNQDSEDNKTIINNNDNLNETLNNKNNNNNNSFTKQKDFGLSAIKNIWPFNKSTINNNKAINENNQMDKRKSTTGTTANNDTSINRTNSILSRQKKSSKQIKPFVTIGRGYRNLLDRFTYCSQNEQKKSSYHQNHHQSDNTDTNAKGVKLKDSSKFHAIIWDSGFWNFS